MKLDKEWINSKQEPEITGQPRITRMYTNREGEGGTTEHTKKERAVTANSADRRELKLATRSAENTQREFIIRR